MNPKDILSKAEMTKERMPQELSIWVEDRHSLFWTSKESRKYCREGRGLSKKFIKSEGGLENLLLLIKKAAEGKSNKPYGSQHILLVVFSNYLSFLLKEEDKYPENSSYIKSFKDSVYRDIVTLPLDFQIVYVFDYSSSIFLPIPIEKYNLG